MPEIPMPKMGDSMEEGTIVRWLKHEGDAVAEEEPIAEIQTEKANIEINAYSAGTLTRILVPEGQTVPVGAPIAVVNGDEGSVATAAAPSRGAAPPAVNGATAERPAKTEPPPVEQKAPPPHTQPPAGYPAPEEDAVPAARPEPLPAPLPPEPAPPAPLTERVKASPLARKIAAQHGVDLAQVHGTGPGGRIVEADVETFREGAPAAPVRGIPTAPAATPTPAAPAGAVAAERPLSPMRKTIARRLTESKQTIPHFYLTADMDVEPLVALRAQYNAFQPEQRRISFNDLVVKACAVALPGFPPLNSQLAGDTVRTMAGVHVGVAVALDEGLIVPVIRDCQAKSLTRIAAEIREKAARARQGRLTPDEYSGGTFTVSNLGMYDVEQFAAVINPPEPAILAVGAIRDEPVVKNDAVVPGKRMRVTISVDHRIVDGAVAARFLQELKRLIQAPLSLFE